MNEKSEKVTCGRCLIIFDTNDDYLEHTCKETGFTPTDSEHFGSQFPNVQIASLKRGKIKKDELAKEN